MLSWAQLNCKLGMMVFEESGKLRVTTEKPLGADQGLNTGHIDET